MSEYQVKKKFYDIKTRSGYRPGQNYKEDDKERAERLVIAGLIEGDEPTNENGNQTEWPKHTGGGWYELSNGEKMQGKEEAIEAQAQLGE